MEEPSMKAKDIRKAITRRPFMPLAVQMTSGKEFNVSHPEAIWQAPEPDEDTIIIHVRDVGIVFTDPDGIADIVFAGKRTAASAEGG
jgi:hypothetical protein